ncbi:MAG: EAL domain-containing protein [Lachnospiraceae bacterium]|jgi:EAL domain-containing protein (putative c-di-GMP-specific phosphodiesterase class I)/GGDEF domain-containing protein|nr:EAL domain-containing protein [Lachnospiraceae bacterium]
MYEIHVEIAAAGFFALLFFANLVKKQLPSRRTAAFQLLLCAMMIASFIVAGADLCMYYKGADRWAAVVKAIGLYAEVLCLISFHCYILSAAYRLSLDSPLVLSECILFLLITFLILSSPWTKWCFYLDSAGIFHPQTLFLVIGLFLMEHLIMDFFIVWVHYKEHSLKRRVYYSLLLFIFFCAIAAEMTQRVRIESITSFILFALFAFYLSLQSPGFYVDTATGAYNRDGFFEMLKERIAYCRKTSCLLLRVRNFHSMNQIYGEEILQEVQRQIYFILKENGRNGTVYHIGASTFALILRDENQLKSVYEQLSVKIPTEWLVKNEVVKHEYSFYQISYPKDCQNYEELVQRIHYARSDHDTHHKAGSLVLLHRGAVEESEAKKKVAHLLEEAVMDNSIEIHFQPIYSIEKEKITSLEVLARLKDENKNYINPEYFIHVAEESHTIIPLGEQIFRKACIFANRNKIFDYGIEDININLSPGQCRYEGLTEVLEGIAKEHGIPMSKMHLEITESEFTDADAVGRTLRRLKETGAKVALDDFGTGYSTLSNILELPVDFVKIDKSLVWSFAEGKNQFLNDLMPMIKAEGKKIIAEGIETQEHIEIIKRLQGDFLQGYHYARPLPEKNFMRFLKEFNAEC